MKKLSKQDLFVGLFDFRHQLNETQKVVLGILGMTLFITLWWAVVFLGFVPRGILPNPFDCVTSIVELHFEDALVRNIFASLKLNLLGYGLALVIAVPIGFLMGLFPIFRGLGINIVNPIRYLPLAAATGVFIMWFGTEGKMKVSFLAFSILVYVIPVMIHRVDEVEAVHLDTMETLGASRWHTFKHLYWPSVMSRVWYDVIVLVAISWTYIIIAELINRSEGGVGSLLYAVARQSRPDKLFALLGLIAFIGFLQDRFFRWLGGIFFPYRKSGVNHA